MIKDLTKSHFWILMCRGYDVERIWDINYSPENPEILYIDFKYPLGKNSNGIRQYEYHRYKYFIKDRKELFHLSIIKEDNYDYNKYFSNNGLAII